MAKKEKVALFEKTWNKDVYLRQQLNTRSRDFYIKRSYKYLNFSITILVFSLLLVSINGIIIHKNTKEKSYYLTGIDGKVYEVKVNDEKIEKINRALNTYYSQKNK